MFRAEDKLLLVRELSSLSEGEIIAGCAPSPAFIRYQTHYGYNTLTRDIDCAYTAGTFVSTNRCLVGHLWWQPEANASVIIAHGLFDHTGLYLKLVAMLLNMGFNVASVDFVGHGLSDGEPTAVEDFNQYAKALADFRDVLASAWPKQFSGPVYLVGQSTGCSVITCYLAKYYKPVTAVVFLAPLLRPQGWWAVNFSYWLVHRYLQKIPRKYSRNSHDENFLHFLSKHDALQSTSLQVKWVRAMRRWVRRFSALPRFNVPVLIIQGKNDSTVDWRFNIGEFLSKFICADIQYIPNAMHHLVNESEDIRCQVFNLCRQFLDKNR